MEELLNGIGIAALVILALVGLAVGWVASLLTGGRRRALYMIVGALAAMATPFLLAALGVTILAAGGLLLVVIVALIGAALVLALIRAIAK
ncbi:putative membrane protein YeaQ/YmgE (transglycosylase-associated protein family) [Limimaricola variabilis]|uniref:Membrane protein YeaQ/YmgE (Transglycosylase-associated protein family) n=1 Tax=Limimaricola variabilis TaxID=1492771 RepID=A0ABR6HMD0_9RHOB|nr:GlsB/YeaQ/YmgE family stress response membrane protein [Limimaricola variabilis]MBB3711693.1 putative membrane protein YeaQ/YmgE (transglycosylase-associated protein family) [Limimaricola variabilis]